MLYYLHLHHLYYHQIFWLVLIICRWFNLMEYISAVFIKFGCESLSSISTTKELREESLPDQNQGHPREYGQAKPTKPLREHRGIKGLVRLRDDRNTVVEIKEEYDWRDKIGQRRSHEDQKYRTRETCDDQHGGDERKEHAQPIDVVLRIPRTTVFMSQIIRVKPTQSRSLREQIAATCAYDSWPTIKIVEGSRERGCEGTEHEDNHHPRANTFCEDGRDLSHNCPTFDLAWVHPYSSKQQEDGGKEE